jgi:hypothetical protein
LRSPKRSAVVAAGWLKNKSCIPGILKALKTKDEFLPSFALEALGHIGDNSQTVLDAIRESAKLGNLDIIEANEAIRRLNKGKKGN